MMPKRLSTGFVGNSLRARFSKWALDLTCYARSRLFMETPQRGFALRAYYQTQSIFVMEPTKDAPFHHFYTYSPGNILPLPLDKILIFRVFLSVNVIINDLSMQTTSYYMFLILIFLCQALSRHSQSLA